MIPFSPTAAMVRRHDRERYLTTLFAPAESRDSLFALYAFNYELARAREMVSEPLLGRMRLQWWRDTLDEIYSDAPTRRHDVALALANAIRKHQLTRAHLEALIDSREADMVDEPPGDLAALEAYAAASSGRLVLLALEILGVREEAATAAGSEIGTAHALAGLMRAVVFHARARRVFLPSDLVGESARRALLELQPHAALPTAVAAIAELARARLQSARSRRADIRRAALPALLAGVLAERSLDRLAKAKYNVFARRLVRPDATLVTRLGLAALRHRY